MGKKLLSAALLVVSYNFLFLADSASHVKVGLIWLAVVVLLWLPEIGRRLNLGL